MGRTLVFAQFLSVHVDILVLKDYFSLIHWLSFVTLILLTTTQPLRVRDLLEVYREEDLVYLDLDVLSR